MCAITRRAACEKKIEAEAAVIGKAKNKKKVFGLIHDRNLYFCARGLPYFNHL